MRPLRYVAKTFTHVGAMCIRMVGSRRTLGSLEAGTGRCALSHMIAEREHCHYTDENHNRGDGR